MSRLLNLNTTVKGMRQLSFWQMLVAKIWLQMNEVKSRTGLKSVARASSSQGRVQHGLEEILDEEISAGSEEQVPQSPKRRVVERVAPCKRDALRLFNDTVLNPVD